MNSVRFPEAIKILNDFFSPIFRQKISEYKFETGHPFVYIKFVQYIMYRQYTTYITQDATVTKLCDIWIHVSALTGHLQSNLEQRLRYSKNNT